MQTTSHHRVGLAKGVGSIHARKVRSPHAGDFSKRQGQITLAGETGTRTVTLSTTAIAFLAEHAQDKLPVAPLLTDGFGNRWNKDSWKKSFREACRAAKLPDTVVIYTLRHVAISELIAGGTDSFIVAKLAGTSTAMIHKY